MWVNEAFGRLTERNHYPQLTYYRLSVILEMGTILKTRRNDLRYRLLKYYAGTMPIVEFMFN